MDALAKLLQEKIIEKHKEGYFNQYDDSIILAVPINKEQYEFKKDGTFLGIKPIYEDRNLNDKNCQASLTLNKLSEELLRKAGPEKVKITDRSLGILFLQFAGLVLLYYSILFLLWH